jgi:hypothetical protein
MAGRQHCITAALHRGITTARQHGSSLAVQHATALPQHGFVNANSSSAATSACLSFATNIEMFSTNHDGRASPTFYHRSGHFSSMPSSSPVARS